MHEKMRKDTLSMRILTRMLPRGSLVPIEDRIDLHLAITGGELREGLSKFAKLRPPHDA